MPNGRRRSASSSGSMRPVRASARTSPASRRSVSRAVRRRMSSSATTVAAWRRISRSKSPSGPSARTPASHAGAPSRAATASASPRPSSVSTGCGAGSPAPAAIVRSSASSGSGSPPTCEAQASVAPRRLTTTALPPIASATTARIAVEAALLEHEALEMGVDLGAAAQRGVGVVDELHRRALADRDERQLVGHLEQRQRQVARGLRHRVGDALVQEARAEPDRDDAVLDEPHDVLALGARVEQLVAGRQHELAALQPRRRVAQVAGVRPAHARARARLAGDELQSELRQQVLDGQHRATRSLASVRTGRRIDSISANSSGPAISGGASWMTGSPRSSTRQMSPRR